MVNATIGLLSNSTGLYDFGNFANIATGYNFWMLIMIGIFFIITIKLYIHGVERAIASASFSCLMLSVPLLYLDWLNPVFSIIMALSLAASLAYIRFSESN